MAFDINKLKETANKRQEQEKQTKELVSTINKNINTIIQNKFSEDNFQNWLQNILEKELIHYEHVLFNIFIEITPVSKNEFLLVCYIHIANQPILKLIETQITELIILDDWLTRKSIYYNVSNTIKEELTNLQLKVDMYDSEPNINKEEKDRYAFTYLTYGKIIV